MDNSLSLFEKFLFEAPGDEEPAADVGTDDTGPPDMPDDTDTGEDPPDMPTEDEEPPDMPPDEEFGGDDGGFGDGGEMDDQGTGGNDENQNLHLDDKVSAIMNMSLYQKFLSLLNTITSHQSMINSNSDVLYTIIPDAFNDTQSSLKKLEENIRLYLRDTFINENYGKNLLFFNKCLNLLKFLDDAFGQNVRKGIKEIE